MTIISILIGMIAIEIILLAFIAIHLISENNRLRRETKRQSEVITTNSLMLEIVLKSLESKNANKSKAR